MSTRLPGTGGEAGHRHEGRGTAGRNARPHEPRRCGTPAVPPIPVRRAKLPRSAASLSAVTWWAWTLLWVVLVAGAGLVLYLVVRRLLRQGMALARELGDAAEMLAEVTRTLEAVSADATPAEP